MEMHVLFSIVESFWRNLGHYPIAIQQAQGHLGGLWVMAKKDNYIYQVLDNQRQTITFTMSLNRKEFGMSNGLSQAI